MRMNIFDKFLLAVILLILLAVSLFIGCIAVGLVPFSLVPEYLGSLNGMWSVNAWILGGIALVLFIVVIRLIVASYSGGSGAAYTRLSVTENGEIAISIPTIKQITAAFIATKQEVVASSSDILPVKDGLVVRLKICVKEGTVLPEVTAGVQKELKAHLESVTGLVIRQVAVLVDNNRSNYAGKGR
jgi:hypothetical protein